ncbi:tellurite resistance/C4-dicarboxylate transporter family protein [Streptomyces africanus]|uniref:tellurite resistance/C4-dicarboxylate transporter family protein n=1 Tax=Streptomyces africanus TaxID=231024 RepID=UPI00117F7515|nr:tellurite resistance/C4-dicarboxylate transporter family protein [Streptomyces africanus]
MTRPALLDRCRRLPPACFAPVMATGAVSRVLAQSDARTTSALLLGIAVAAYVTLLAATVLKALHHRDALRAELRDPARLFGHFTFVAASGVLATRLVHGPTRGAAYALLCVAAVVWTALAGAAVALARSGGRTMLRYADGTWFLATVGLQALALTVVGLHPGRAVITATLALWATGVLMYTVTLTSVVLRLLRDPPEAAHLAPTYWITMGAAAISTLAGAQLITSERLLPRPARVPLDTAVTVLWSWATVLIVPLLAAGVWRHLYHRVPLPYDLTLWCIVFPLGMYTTATAQLATVRGTTALTAVERPLVCVAAAAWLAVAARFLTAPYGPART